MAEGRTQRLIFSRLLRKKVPDALPVSRILLQGVVVSANCFYGVRAAPALDKPQGAFPGNDGVICGQQRKQGNPEC